MLIVPKRRYTRKYVIGGAGIFDTVTGVFKRLFTSDVANRAASTALSLGKNAARELGKKALDVGMTTAVEAGKRLIDKGAAKLLASPVLASPAASTPLTRENAAILTRLFPNNTVETNINNILAGDGLGSAAKAVSIRDLVRHLNNNKNGAGLKLA